MVKCSHRQCFQLKPKDEHQEAFLDSLKNNHLTVCRSKLFGSGKTFCAIGHAAQELRSHNIERVIFCRDSTVMTDRLGFMPGSRSEKISEAMKFAVQYFRMFLGDQYSSLCSHIEYRDVADLAGETFVDSFMILDEASDCFKDDIAMFVSRAGVGTRCCILGTDRQVHCEKSFFPKLFTKLNGVPGVGLVELRETYRNSWLGPVLKAIDS